MSGQDSRRTSTPAVIDEAGPPMPSWKGWIAIGLILSIGLLLLYFGLSIVVQLDRRSADRVDAIVQRRFLGVLPLSSEIVIDVVNTEVYQVWARTSGGGRQRRGSTVALELTSRQGAVIRRTQFGPALGDGPYEMVARISPFLSDSSSRSLTTWWMPWLVNIGALPFMLLASATVGEVILRALGVFKPKSPAALQ